MPPVSPTQDLKPATTLATPFPKKKAKPKLRAKTRAKMKSRLESEQDEKAATPPSLPPEILLEAKTEAKIKARLESEPKEKKTTTLLSLPREILLNIADNFLDDYLSWRNGYPSDYRGNLQQLDLFRNCTSHEVQYVRLARSHPVFWNLLKGRKIPRAVLMAAKAKAKARRESWRHCDSNMNDYEWGLLWAAS